MTVTDGQAQEPATTPTDPPAEQPAEQPTDTPVELTPDEQAAEDLHQAMTDDDLDAVESTLDRLEAEGELPAKTASEIKKMRKELKSLRSSRNEQQERYATFEAVHPDDLAALTTFADHLKAGDTDGAVGWLASALQAIAGPDADLASLFGIDTPAEQPADDGDGEEELSIEELVAKQVEERLAAEKQQQEERQRIAEVKRVASETAASLGYDTDADNPAFMALLSMAARLPASGDVATDITEADRALKAAFASGAGNSPEGEGMVPPPEGAEPKMPTNATPVERMKARLDRELGPPES